jgi:hypothetical protein
MDEHTHQRPDARSAGGPFTIGRDVHIDRGGGALLIARRDMHVSRGGGQWLVAMHDQTINQGGGAVLVSRQARVTSGFVGVVVAGRVSLEGRARAMVTLSGPLLVGAAIGLTVGLLFGRRRTA